jgi:glycopeptide antibiotics resistance protein
MLEGWVVYPLAAALGVAFGLRAAWLGRGGFTVALTALFVLHLGWLAGATLFPVPLDATVRALEAAAGPDVAVDLRPLRGVAAVIGGGTPRAIVWLVGGNVLVFAPFGFMLPIVWRSACTWRRVAAAGLALSLAIETTQFGVSLLVGYAYRVTEIDDVMLNVAGVLLGFALYRLVRPRPEAERRSAPPG